MERIWIIVSGCLALTAGVLLWFQRFDGAFVCGALGILAWFINMRQQLRKNSPVMENGLGHESDRQDVQDED